MDVLEERMSVREGEMEVRQLLQEVEQLVFATTSRSIQTGIMTSGTWKRWRSGFSSWSSDEGGLLLKGDFQGSAGVHAGGCYQYGAEVDRVRCGVGGVYTGVLGEADLRAYSRDISSGVRSCHISWTSHNEGASRDISSSWHAGQLSTSVTNWMSCRCRVMRFCQFSYRLKWPMGSLIGFPSNGSVWTA